MKLLAATNRYYVLLSIGVFVVGSGALYVGVNRALRHEVGEQLQAYQQEIPARVASGRSLPEPLYRQQFSVSALAPH